jgi:hypothetical protein
MILRTPSGSGRCNAFASSHGAHIHTSRSSSVVRITGMAFGWIGSTMAFGEVSARLLWDAISARIKTLSEPEPKYFVINRAFAAAENVKISSES